MGLMYIIFVSFHSTWAWCILSLSLFNIFRKWSNDYSQRVRVRVIGTPSYEGSGKIAVVCLAICPSVYLQVYQFGVFLRNGSIVFSDFWHNCKYLEYLKPDRALLSRKIHFCPNLGKKGPKCPQKRVFFETFFWNILWLVILGNNLKWKLILLLIFHHQSLIWQNFDSPFMGQNAVSQSNCKIL